MAKLGLYKGKYRFYIIFKVARMAEKSGQMVLITQPLISTSSVWPLLLPVFAHSLPSSDSLSLNSFFALRAFKIAKSMKELERSV